MSRSILITGGAGFIGSRLIRALTTADPASRIAVLDNLHPQVHGVGAAPPVFPANVVFARGDVADAAVVHEVVRAACPDLVYHLAAETGTGQSFDEPTRYARVNVLGTTNLVEALRTVGSVRRVVLAGSRAVYGEGAYRDVSGTEFVGLPRTADCMGKGDYSVPLPSQARLPAVAVPSHSGLPPAPASVYASTKLMQEYLLAQTGEGASWCATVLRFQNVYGPGQSLRNPYTGVLSIFARQLLAGQDLAIFEDGAIARDFVYVDDVVDALVRAGDRPVPHGTVIDIGTGSAATILHVAKTLMRALDRPQDAFRVTGAFRTGDIRHACANIDKAGQLLGWAPQVNIEEGLLRLAAWARQEYGSVAQEG